MKQKATKAQEDFANIVKRKAWANNVRATTKGVPVGCVLVNKKWLVGMYDVRGVKNAPQVNFRAIVRTYGPIQRVEIYNLKNLLIPSFFYRIGRR
jgi:hypothetical protein